MFGLTITDSTSSTPQGNNVPGLDEAFGEAKLSITARDLSWPERPLAQGGRCAKHQSEILRFRATMNLMLRRRYSEDRYDWNNARAQHEPELALRTAETNHLLVHHIHSSIADDIESVVVRWDGRVLRCQWTRLFRESAVAD